MKELMVWQAGTGKLLYSEEEIYLEGRALDFGPDGETLVYYGHDGLELRNIRTGAIVTIVTAGEGVIRVWGMPPWP